VDTTILRQARHAALLTQQELARLAGTSQSAVAAYESGRRTPKLDTLTSLLETCGYEVRMTAVPRTRQGALSLEEIARVIAEVPPPVRPEDALRLVFGFTDDFRGSSVAGRRSLIAQAPGRTGERRFDALLAGTAEFFTAESQLPVPRWVDDPDRFCEPFWVVARSPGLEPYVIARSPAAFSRHGVFIAREVFDRA
jgi:transcriptional regulator with XRE-family HTH domain